MPTKNRKTASKKLNVINIRVDDQMLADLKELAEEQARPLSNLVVYAVRVYLAEEKKKKSVD